jgi:hypothetical protein
LSVASGSSVLAALHIPVLYRTYVRRRNLGLVPRLERSASVAESLLRTCPRPAAHRFL